MGGPHMLTIVNMLRLLLVLHSGLLYAQSTATLSGRVLDASGAAVEGAAVAIEHRLSGFRAELITDATGVFRFANLPLQSYAVQAAKDGFRPARSMQELRSNVPVSIDLKLEIPDATAAVEVTAEDKAQLVDPQETSTRAQMDRSEMERLPLQVGNRGLESVLVTFPGFAQNANGAIHPRGAHNQMTFVVDGMPVTDQLTGAFGNAVDAGIVESVEMFTGHIPAEYGMRVAAVANVTTRSGLGSGDRFHGSVMMSGAGFDTASGQAQVAGALGRFGYSASLQAMKTNRYLDQVSLDNLHNGGNVERGFLRLDYQLGNGDTLRFSGMAGRSAFELANLRSQHVRGMDQRQALRDVSGSLGWVHLFGPQATFDTTVSWRTAGSRLVPSAGDFPVSAEQSRTLTTVTGWHRVNVVRGGHTLKAGVDWQVFPVKEFFRFAITDGEFNVPGTADFIPTLVAHDVTRGGRWFSFSDRAAGALYTGFVQDQWRLGRLQLSLGARYDAYRFLVNDSQLQPRVAVAFHLKETGTVLRASYNRTFQTPPNENLLISNSERAAGLVAPDVRATLGGGLAQVRPERQNLVEAGLQQALWGRASANVSYYHKGARDQHDNDNFFNTGIIFPMALARIRVNGVQGRVVLPVWRGWSGSVSATHARAISSPPFTGGLFLGNTAVKALNAGPFVIDHDQKLGVHGLLSYTRRSWYGTLSVRHDSGLVTNPSDPEEVRRDTDYADLLPYVDLLGNPARTRGRTIADVVVGYQGFVNGGEKKRWEVTVQASNVTNRTALYNFQSLFVGTRLVQPRTVGVRVRWWW